jgi:hypothetical protein
MYTGEFLEDAKTGCGGYLGRDGLSLYIFPVHIIHYSWEALSQSSFEMLPSKKPYAIHFHELHLIYIPIHDGAY